MKPWKTWNSKNYYFSADKGCNIYFWHYKYPLLPSIFYMFAYLRTLCTICLPTLEHCVPATRHVTSPPILPAAVIVFSVIGISFWLSCSAITNVLWYRLNTYTYNDKYINMKKWRSSQCHMPISLNLQGVELLYMLYELQVLIF